MSSNTESENAKSMLEADKEFRNGLARISSQGTAEELVKFYNDNSVPYEKIGHLKDSNYQLAVASLVESLSELVPDREAKILDVAAGSGLAGRGLQKAGYTNVDALEPAEKMLDIAKSANLYKNYIIDIITGDKKCSVEDDAYDALIIMAGVVRGHINIEYLPELMRITKKGGVIVFNVTERYLQRDYPFKGGEHVNLFQGYVDRGEWLKWDERKAPYRQSEQCSIFRIMLA